MKPLVGRAARGISIGVLVIAPIIVALEFWTWVLVPGKLDIVASDYHIVVDAAGRWVNGGSYFLPRQLGGPYEMANGDVLYPPVALWLFLPFTRLPALLWWAIPFAVTGAALWRLRPSLAGWALIALCFTWPRTWGYIVGGNPSIWVVAVLAAAIAFGTPASLLLFKPSLFPFALVGIRRRGWWLGIALLVLGSLPLLPLTFDWFRVMADSHNDLGPFFAIYDLPLQSIPLLAWLASPRFGEWRERRALRRAAAGTQRGRRDLDESAVRSGP